MEPKKARNPEDQRFLDALSGGRKDAEIAALCATDTSTSEACNQMEQAAVANALREIGRKQRLEALQAEFDATEHGVDLATPESLARLMQQIREAYQDLANMAVEHIGSPEHILAVDCLRALIREYNIQDSELAVRRD
jgi:hypothetical protein